MDLQQKYCKYLRRKLAIYSVHLNEIRTKTLNMFLWSTKGDAKNLIVPKTIKQYSSNNLQMIFKLFTFLSNRCPRSVFIATNSPRAINYLNIAPYILGYFYSNQVQLGLRKPLKNFNLSSISYEVTLLFAIPEIQVF